MDKVFEVVKDSINEILSMNGLEGREITQESKIIQDIGLKSLDIAQLIAMLEVEYEKDPFTNEDASLADILTVGDLCKLYM